MDKSTTTEEMISTLRQKINRYGEYYWLLPVADRLESLNTKQDKEDTTIIVNFKDDDDRDHEKHEHDQDHNSWLEQLITHQINKIIQTIQKAEHNIMANLDALTAAVANDTTVDQAIITLLNGLAQQLRDLIAQGIIDPVELQSLVDQITANSDAISAAVVANTPVVEPPVEPV